MGDVIAHRWPDMASLSNLDTFGLIYLREGLELMSSRHCVSTIELIALLTIFFHLFLVGTFSSSCEGNGSPYRNSSCLILLNQLSSEGDFVASWRTAIAFSIPSAMIQRPNRLSMLLCITHSRGKIPNKGSTAEFWVLSGSDCICFRVFLWYGSNTLISFPFMPRTSKP